MNKIVGLFRWCVARALTVALAALGYLGILNTPERRRNIATQTSLLVYCLFLQRFSNLNLAPITMMSSTNDEDPFLQVQA